MRTIRIYQPGQFALGDSIMLDEKAGQHVGVVLRMQPGKEIVLFDGENHEWQAQIVSVHKKNVTVLLTQKVKISRESCRKIHLAQAISKGDRMEIVVQKAVELGVASITPLITAHCAFKMNDERLIKKWKQWQAIAVAACEQCGRNEIPLIKPPQVLSSLSTPSTGFILAPEEGKSWRHYDVPFGEITLLIGPEGGFNKEEVTLAKNAGFAPLTLGPRILRTETAAITALSVLQAVWGDL